MKKSVIKKISILTALTLFSLLPMGCGKKDDSKDESPVVSQVVTEEPTLEPTATTASTPTPSPFPEIGQPEYKFVFFDHAELYDRYYSSYYIEFDEPGYYLAGKYALDGFYDSETGEKYPSPYKTITGKIPVDEETTRYYAVFIFMSKEDNLPEENLTFVPDLMYRFDSSNFTEVEADPFEVNTAKEDIDFYMPGSTSYPICLDGHYMILDSGSSGVAYGSPEDDPSKDYCAREYFYIRLSYEDMDYDSMKEHLDIYAYDTESKQYLPFVTNGDIDKYIGISQSTDDGLRYCRIAYGLAFPKEEIDGRVYTSTDAEQVTKNLMLVVK